jgi:hypothetical protein
VPRIGVLSNPESPRVAGGNPRELTELDVVGYPTELVARRPLLMKGTIMLDENDEKRTNSTDAHDSSFAEKEAAVKALYARGNALGMTDPELYPVDVPSPEAEKTPTV